MKIGTAQAGTVARNDGFSGIKSGHKINKRYHWRYCFSYSSHPALTGVCALGRYRPLSCITKLG
jgi:hypothetical protein